MNLDGKYKIKCKFLVKAQKEVDVEFVFENMTLEDAQKLAKEKIRKKLNNDFKIIACVDTDCIKIN